MSGELAKAVCQVMRQCTFIPQTGKNSFHKYTYASDADLLTVLQPAMAEAGLALIPHKVDHETVEHCQDRKGKAQYRTEVTITYLLLHTSGEQLTLQASGCGVDGEDKGIYKAKTGALKYALRHLFLVPTGDDAERHRVDQEARRRDQGQPSQGGGGRQNLTAAPPHQPPIQRVEDLPLGLVEALKEGGWDRETLLEDVRDFVCWVTPPGRVFDPWAASAARLAKLPGWLATQTEELEAWMNWLEAFRATLLTAELTREGLDRWLLAHNRPAVGRSDQGRRRELRAALEQVGRVDQIKAWLTAHAATG